MKSVFVEGPAGSMVWLICLMQLTVTTDLTVPPYGGSYFTCAKNQMSAYDSKKAASRSPCHETDCVRLEIALRVKSREKVRGVGGKSVKADGIRPYHCGIWGKECPSRDAAVFCQAANALKAPGWC